ncbi:hypothetical protein DRQ07_02400 [candidate division KSB1 bacterium]|nr:MAG: hypothetical protein DRQ07_02400 [candidate division KSB1 bacterium]
MIRSVLKIKKYFLIFIPAIVITGCSTIFVSEEKPCVKNPEQLLSGIRKNAGRLRTFKARGKLIVNTKGMGLRGTISIKARIPDSLWLKIEGPLGIDVATGIFSEESALMYSPLENVLWKGSYSSVVEKGYVPGAINSSNFVLSVVGLPFPSDTLFEKTDSVKVSKNGGFVIYLKFQTLWVDKRGLITKWEKCNASGEPEWLWEGKRFVKKGGVFLPRLIRITAFNPKKQVTILYEEIKTNKAIKKGFYKIDIPKGVRTIEL